MPLSRFRRAVAPLTAALFLLAACGNGGGDAADPSGPSAAKGAGGESLSGVCPGTLVVQTQWLPDVSPEGPLYALLGDDMDIDAEKKKVTAPLVAGGRDTGIDLELRAGGPAIGYTQTSAQMYADKDIHLGVTAGFDEVIQNSRRQPTVALTALLEKDPQMIFWDPQTYPEFHSIADIGKTDTTVLYFEGDTYMEYLLSAGILKKSQVDGSADGSPARFVSESGEIASSGYAVSDPYAYEKVLEPWGKPIDFQLLYDTGYEVYGPPLVVRAQDKAELAPCLEKLVPLVQQAQIDFMADPERTIANTVEIAGAYRGGDIFTEEVGEYSVKKMAELQIAANDAEGKDATVGDFETDRVQRVIDVLKPVFGKQRKPLRDGLAPDDVVTNEFIDTEIGFGDGR